MLDKFIELITELKKKSEPFAMALVVNREAPSSGKAGDRAIIRQNGQLIGWIGGGCVKGIVLKEAADAIQTGKPRLVRIGKNINQSQKHRNVMEYKMTCQSEGTVEIFIEAVLPQPHLVVIGKTEIANALTKLGHAAGFRITGVAKEAGLKTFHKVDELITQIDLSNVKTGPLSFIVVATQGEDDEKAMMTAVGKQAAYLGFVASRKKSLSIIQYLRDAGVEEALIGKINSPAGLDINAKQPDEVAISILAEIIQVKNGLSVLVSQDIPSGDGQPVTAPDYYINPVCGVPVDKNNPRHVIEYKGESVYFCCDGCKVKFEKDPEKYIQAREKGLEYEGM